MTATLNARCMTLALGAWWAVGAGAARAETPTPAAAPADDRYQFTDGASETQHLTLAATATGARATWPAPATKDWDTALVGVTVSAAAEKGEAWIDVTAGAARVRQHLDAGARGLRWLNVSPLRPALAGGAPIEFAAHGTALRPATVVVRLFANHVPRGRPLLVLAPHPDDAEIAAFGFYAGQPATIVTVTAGNAGDANYRDDFPDDAEQYAFKGYLRAVDSVTVPWQGGIPPQRCFNLGYFDARLQDMHDKPDAVVAEMYGPNQDVARYRRVNLSHLLPNSARTATWAHLVEDLATILRKVRPAVIVMPHPILDEHPDHDFVTVAAAQALERWKQPVMILLYSNHSAGNRQPYGPAETDVSLPPWSSRALNVQRVYSHPVDKELRRRKLYALESMHDLRLSPSEQSCGPGPRRPDYPRTPDVDYFRRGPRPEEMFFVYDRAGLKTTVSDFLAHPPAP
jgi:LmbE family N-acetylglucosaminyl deacetylase